MDEERELDIDRFLGDSSDPGRPPGTLEYIGEETREEVKISLRRYDQKNSELVEDLELDDLEKEIEKGRVNWIDVNGLHETDKIAEISEIIGIHPVLRDDIVNTTQRPKLEEQEDYIFVQLKMLRIENDQLISDQLSIVFNENTVVSFQEPGADVFEPVRKRISGGKGKIRTQKADYLAYALIDAVVDNYFSVLDKLGGDIEDLEESIIEDPDQESMEELRNLKRELVLIRKHVWPLREVLSELEKSDSELISDDTRIYIRDVYENIVQVMDVIETFRDLASSTMDLHSSVMNNRMNEVMKLLTIIATVFIPLTFIAGVYGMNFDPSASPWNMPELGLEYGYPAVMTFMVLIAVLEVIYFRRKGWI